MPSYIELISELSDLTKQAEQVGAPLGRDAIGEALTALKDLARLEERIRKTMSGLDALDSQEREG